jgi:hypothetical protein
MSRANLTRAQASDLISDCTTLEQLLDLQAHWIGHRDHLPEDTAETLAAMLYGYADDCADDAAPDTTRSNGPKGSDRTGLTAPNT